MLTPHEIAKMIDHALLKPEMDEEAVRKGLLVAKKYDTASVCVRPCDLKLAAEVLAGTDVKLCTVIGFPHGSNRTEVKLLEAQLAMDDGCTELDMVVNIGKLRSGDYEYVFNDIRTIVEAGHARGALIKVIMENAYLNEDEKIKLCEICAAAGADFTKTSTGFASSGATLEDIVLMRRNTPDHMQVKAAGGVRTLDQALAFRAAGCARLGATATEAIMTEAEKRFAEKGTLD